MDSEHNKKMGIFISEKRKAQNLTQKDLAEKLGVTDKAVSKWERGISCPDISLLVPLAKILKVTTSELLNGDNSELEPPTEALIEEALLYSSKNSSHKIKKVKNYTFVFLSLTFLIGILVSFICDYCITGHLTWSLIVILSTFFGWLLLVPFFTVRNHAVKMTLIILTLFTVPYLAALGWILKEPFLFRIGTGITIISIIAVWCIYAVFTRICHRKLWASGISLLICIPMVCGINQVVSYFYAHQSTSISNTIINCITLLILSILCFIVDFFKTKNQESL